MHLKRSLLILSFLIGTTYSALAQCDALSSNRSVDFSADQNCAPVTVDTFRVTYRFLLPQDPATISIVYQWNDPANTITTADIGNGLVASGGNMVFTSDKQFTYVTNDNRCSIRPITSLFINGVECLSTRQQQVAPFWGSDDEANGEVTIAPQTWDVCHDNAIVNATFEDASEFNCNPVEEPDNPNVLSRHVQFVYGTNHNPGATIRNLTLTDGGPQGLTNGTGNLVSSSTRGTGAQLVTGAYFGPVQAIPFPATGPASVSFPMNAPADPANLVGNRFEITMFNWNICNPYNGDPANPNYEDAIETQAYITIVDAPAPNFVTRDGANVITTNFCINEVIRLDNLTPNAANYDWTWRFYSNPTGAGAPVAVRTTFEPTFAYGVGGQKLIRLTASNPTAQSPCIETFEVIVNITPALVATIRVTDLSNVDITPDFCQEASPPLTNFNARFTDASVGTVTGNTRWRWEFYDETNAMIAEFPGGGGFSTTILGPFNRVFTNPGVYRVRLITRDNVTTCESTDEVEVRVLRKPAPSFTATEECVGDATTFTDATTLTPIDGQAILSREWDLNYDGVTFDSDPTLLNQTTFTHTFPAAGTYRVALRVTTDQGSCADIFDQEVEVNPLPLASFTATPLSGCSVLNVTFTNTAIGGQPDIVDQYIWEVDEGSGFQVDSIQRPTDPSFGNIYTRDFENTTPTNKTYTVRLRVRSVNGCERVSSTQLITVNPGPESGFVSLNYSPFNSNCSPVSVDFAVDAQTISQNPSDYTWTISDASGVVDQISTGTTPSFTYSFVNNTQAIQDFQIALLATLPTGCSGDSTRTIRVNPVPSSAFTITTVEDDCQHVIVNLDATQKGLAEYDWTISINGIPVFSSVTSGDNFDYEILRSATIDQNISISLQTLNFANCQSGITTNAFDVLQSTPIIADFDATPAAQTLPNATVTITNNTTPGPWTYLWDFGDGVTSNNPNVANHTYTLAGTYTITVTAGDVACSDTHSETITINPAPPILDFSFAPPSGCAPLTVTFTNLSQFADPSTFMWEFGAGQGTSQEVNPNYTYFDDGIYSVTLSASDGAGGRISITKDMIIEVFPSPTAQFEILLRVDQLYTNNLSQNAATFEWDFGDGTTSTDFEPLHLYQAEGAFDIQLVASNANGCTDTARFESAVNVVKSGKLLVPNAFAPLLGPNSGGNDVFLPLMQNVTKFNMLVFDRWGNLLFETKDPEVGWNGTYKGVLCPQDVYVYKITVEYNDGNEFTKTGDVTLIR